MQDALKDRAPGSNASAGEPNTTAEPAAPTKTDAGQSAPPPPAAPEAQVANATVEVERTAIESTPPPGQPALAAAEKPEPGDWLYFVTIDLQGTTVFTRDYQQHLANIELAQRNGVLDSAR